MKPTGYIESVIFAKRIHIDRIVVSSTIKLTIWQRLLKWLQKQMSLIKYFDE